MFLRPVEDTKSFSGTIMNKDEYKKWREDVINLKNIEYSSLNKDTQIFVSEIKEIYSEYRMFIVDGKIATGSIYKIGNRVVSNINNFNDTLNPDEEILKATQKMVDKWQPDKAFVIDMAKTPEGIKVIEINNINSSGFYSSDVFKIVAAIED